MINPQDYLQCLDRTVITYPFKAKKINNVENGRLNSISLFLKIIAISLDITPTLQIMLNLTEDAIDKLTKVESGMNENYVVDIYKFLKIKDNLKSFQFTDGKQKFKGVVQVTSPRKDLEAIYKKANNQTLRIKIKQHFTHFKEGKAVCIEIVDFQIMQQNTHKPKAKPSISVKTKAFTKIEDDVRIQRFIKKESLQVPQQVTFPAQKAEAKKPIQEPQTSQCQPGEVNIKGYEKISDLYQTFHGWELLARVADLNYRQFTSKAGKLTKLLEVQLIDRIGCIIIGNFFGETATFKKEIIKVGKIYRISKGRIKEEKYYNQASDKHSKYSIIFNMDAEFIQMKDTPQIPYKTTNWIRLCDAENLPVSDLSYNFVGILIEIKDQVALEREGKNILFQHFKIGDPITDITFQCTIWSRQFTIDSNLLGKSIIIKNFRISKYKGQTTLSSTFKSEIAYHDIFSKYDGNLQHFQLKEKDIFVKTLSQLAWQLQQNTTEPVMTNIEVVPSAFLFNQKWYYEACPKCKKTCTSYTQCQGCNLEVSQPTKKYKIQVELADFTGSIRATAFDQTAAIFLKNIEIQDLQKMPPQELMQFGEKFCFQQYRMQVSSKRDQNGRIYHTIVGRPTPLNFVYSSMRNLQEIKNIIQNKSS